jgi:hypothetical protein
MPGSSANKDRIKPAINDYNPPEKYSIIGKLFKPVLVLLKWIAKGSEKEPVCRS